MEVVTGAAGVVIDGDELGADGGGSRCACACCRRRRRRVGKQSAGSGRRARTVTRGGATAAAVRYVPCLCRDDHSRAVYCHLYSLLS